MCTCIPINGMQGLADMIRREQGPMGRWSSLQTGKIRGVWGRGRTLDWFQRRPYGGDCRDEMSFRWVSAAEIKYCVHTWNPTGYGGCGYDAVRRHGVCLYLFYFVLHAVCGWVVSGRLWWVYKTQRRRSWVGVHRNGLDSMLPGSGSSCPRHGNVMRGM